MSDEDSGREVTWVRVHLPDGGGVRSCRLVQQDKPALLDALLSEIGFEKRYEIIDGFEYGASVLYETEERASRAAGKYQTPKPVYVRR